MKQIMSVLVENKAGVLSRTAGLFARRGFNIESLAVGETDDPTVSRMTIVVKGDERTIEQVEKQLNKQIDVIKVKLLETDAATRRELILIKLSATQQNRGEIIDIAAIMNAKIVDLSRSTLTVETVVLLSRKTPDDTIEVDLNLDELDATSAETKATYEEIKKYVKEKYQLKVSNLYISQIKRKCGIEVGINYNLPKSENPKVPQCPPEKERAIRDALEHFQMVS